MVVGLLVVSSSETKKEPILSPGRCESVYRGHCSEAEFEYVKFLGRDTLLLHDGGIIYVTLRNQKDQQISV